MAPMTLEIAVAAAAIGAGTSLLFRLLTRRWRR